MATAVTIRIDEPMRALLEAAASRNGLTTSDIIRRAIEDYLGDDGGRRADVRRAKSRLSYRARLRQVLTRPPA
jgi:predicted transcriptional regulator